MSRKVFLLILIPALILISSYAALQIYLRKGAAKGETKEQLMASQSTEGGGLAGNAAKKGKENEEGASGTDSLDGKKASPLDLRPLFIQKLQQLVKTSTNGLYNLSIGNMEVDVLASEVSLQDVTLRPDDGVMQRMVGTGSLPAAIYTASFESLVLDGIHLDDAINSKKMDYKLVKLVRPVIQINRQKETKSGSNEDFSQRFLKEMEKLVVGKLVVEDGTVTVHDKQKNSTKKLQRVQVLMNDILLNSQTRNDKSRFLFAKEAKLQFHDFATDLKGGLYNFRIGDALVNATKREVVLKNVSFGSPLSKEAFVKKHEKATEMYRLLLPSITINGVDWWTALNGDEIAASEMQTKGGKVSVYFDRSMIPQSKMGGFPSQLLSKMPNKLNLARLTMRDLDVSYEEYNPRSGQSGTVYIDNVTMNVSNVRNQQKGAAPLVVNGSGLLMHQVPLKATFHFDMAQAKKGVFTATVNVDGFKGEIMNPIARSLGMFNVDNGEVQTFQLSMKGDEMSATGNVLLLYKNLKVSMQEKNKDKPGLNDKNLLSFLANTFVVKDENTGSSSAKSGGKAVTFKRDPNSGFVNLVWKTALVGILKTMGAPVKLAEKK